MSEDYFAKAVSYIQKAANIEEFYKRYSDIKAGFGISGLRREDLPSLIASIELERQQGRLRPDGAGDF